MKLTKILSLALALVLALGCLCGCGAEPTSSPDVTPAPDSVPEADEGEPAKTYKLVSTAADITEILDGLGHGGDIVLADVYSAGAGSVNSEVCTMDYLNPDVEAIIALSPDCVFVSGSSTDGTVDPYSALTEAGVKVVYIPTAASIQGIKDNIAAIADEVGASDKASELNASIDEAVEAAKKRADGKDPVSVYFEIGAAPWLYTFGNGTFLDEIITVCGGRNIYSAEQGWISNTEETVIAANPEVIITNVMYDGYDYNEILSRPGWEAIAAVKNSRVVGVDANATSRGSQNIVKGIEAISKAIIPDEE